MFSFDITKSLLFVVLKDSGAYLERRVAGLRRVQIQSNGSLKDFTNHPWGYQVIHIPLTLKQVFFFFFFGGGGG